MATARTPSLHELITDELNFGAWSLMMRITLRNEGLWDVVENGVLPHPSRDPDPAATLDFDELCRWRDLVRQDMKALEILQSSLTDSIFKKTFSATSAKELWEMLEQAPDVSFDADMWMVYTNTTNHMTPNEKYFTTLDKTKRDKVTFINGNTVEAQGIGDVRTVTREREDEDDQGCALRSGDCGKRFECWPDE